MKVRNQNTHTDESLEATRMFKSFHDPGTSHEDKLAYKKRKYEELLREIYFLDLHLPQEERRYDYPEDFKPFVFFFKFLARRPDIEITNSLNRLKLWLPDTILTSEGDNPPMWLYSGQDGLVYRTDTFTAKSMVNKLGSFASPDELVAVLKKPMARDFSYIGNDIRLITLKDLSVITQSLMSSRGDVICLQKYIKSIGPKAFICRTCWKRDKNGYVWVVTNNKDYYAAEDRVPETQKFITNPHVMNSCSILKSIRGRYVDETLPYLANLVKFLENNISGTKFEEFVADFVKDESGTWWMINIRGFVLVDKILVNPKPFLAAPDEADLPSYKKRKQHSYQKLGMCKYCEQLYNVEELLHRMTLKSIIQADRHLIHRGKPFKWLERSEIKYLDTDAMCQEHKVCKSCYKLHQEIEKLRELEFEFARALGIPANPDKRPDLVSVTGIASVDEGNFVLPKPELTFSSAIAEEHMSLKASKTSIKDESPVSPQRGVLAMRKYRLMFYLHMIYDIPKDIDANKTFFIEYSVLEQKQRYRIDLNTAFSINGSILIPINKLRVFYMLCYGRKQINDYINEQKVINLNLYCDNEKLGTATFELKDFLSDKVVKREMFKVFSGKKLPILSWGLKATIGIIEGEYEDPRRIKPTEHKNIYLPSPEYFTCEPLPEEWIEIFEETQHQLTNLLSKSDLKTSRYSINVSRADSNKPRNSKSQFAKSSVLKAHTSIKEIKSRFDSLDVPVDNYSSISPGKSLFSDDKSISHVYVEKDNNNESLEVVRQILVESIRDYEKGSIKVDQKKLAKRNAEIQAQKKSSNKSSMRAWSAVLKPIHE